MVFSTIRHFRAPRLYRPFFACILISATASPSLQAQMHSEAVATTPTILERSPFIPPGWAPPQANRPPAAAPKQDTTGYEFRGVYQIGDEYRFLVSKPKSRSGSWVEIGKAYEDYEVRKYDSDSETLVLYYNNKEESVKLAALESNPTPMPVIGQTAVQRGDEDGTPRPVRRTIRPATRSVEDGSGERQAAPPPPAWLERLREEAAARRAQAVGGSGNPGPVGGPPSMNSSGGPDGSVPPPGPPPSLPEELKTMVIPDPPRGFPPTPPPEHVINSMLESIGRPPGN